LDDSIASGGLVGLSANTNWLSNQQLYFKLHGTPSLMQGNAAMGSFEATQAATSLGQLADIHTLTGGLMVLPVALVAQLQGWGAALTAKEGQLSLLVAQWQADPNNTLLWQQANQLQAEMDSLTTQIENARNLAIANRANDAAILLGLNNAVTVNTVYETNLKFTQGIQLLLVAQSQPTAAQMATLQTLARTCFSEGGPATVQARALLATLTGAVSLDHCYGGFIHKRLFTHLQCAWANRAGVFGHG
jgi:hypothetical protein